MEDLLDIFYGPYLQKFNFDNKISLLLKSDISFGEVHIPDIFHAKNMN